MRPDVGHPLTIVFQSGEQTSARTRSSAGLESRPPKPNVTGSNPVGRAKYQRVHSWDIGYASYWRHTKTISQMQGTRQFKMIKLWKANRTLPSASSVRAKLSHLQAGLETKFKPSLFVAKLETSHLAQTY